MGDQQDMPSAPPLGGGPKRQQGAPGAGDVAKVPRPQAKPAAPLTWYKVTVGGNVGGGGGNTVIPVGEVINNVSYSIDKLLGSGIKLEECEPPAWWLAAQGQDGEG